jgi:hypothetical protein
MSFTANRVSCHSLSSFVQYTILSKSCVVTFTAVPHSVQIVYDCGVRVQLDLSRHRWQLENIDHLPKEFCVVDPAEEVINLFSTPSLLKEWSPGNESPLWRPHLSLCSVHPPERFIQWKMQESSANKAI